MPRRGGEAQARSAHGTLQCEKRVAHPLATSVVRPSIAAAERAPGGVDLPSDLTGSIVALARLDV